LHVLSSSLQANLQCCHARANAMRTKRFPGSGASPRGSQTPEAHRRANERNAPTDTTIAPNSNRTPTEHTERLNFRRKPKTTHLPNYNGDPSQATSAAESIELQRPPSDSSTLDFHQRQALYSVDDGNHETISNANTPTPRRYNPNANYPHTTPRITTLSPALRTIPRFYSNEAGVQLVS
jgi:hypothetical protein